MDGRMDTDEHNPDLQILFGAQIQSLNRRTTIPHMLQKITLSCISRHRKHIVGQTQALRRLGGHQPKQRRHAPTEYYSCPYSY